MRNIIGWRGVVTRMLAMLSLWAKKEPLKILKEKTF